MLFSKRIKNIVLLVLVLFLFSSDKALTYDNLIVHPKLSRKASGIYNQNFPNQKLSSEEVNWIVEGTIAEDTDPRYLNHFYNPKTGRGLNDGVFSGHSAKWWAYNQKSISGDYSVPKILENYKEGNKKRAYQGIGHILHLIQDMSVPAHVRNDAHPEGDPFEGWLKQHNPISEDKLSFLEVNDIREIFNSLALFTNNNFFSKDTIDVNEKNLAEFKKIEKKVNNKITVYYVKEIDGQDCRILYLKNPDSIISSYGIAGDVYVNFDYWQQLYPKAIGYSAGAIDYLKKEFKKIDESGEGENLSLWERVKNSVAQKASNLLDGARYVLGDNILEKKQGIDTTYEAGKDAYEKTKRGLAFYYDANREIVVGVFDYSKEKSKEAVDWTSDRFYQAYDKASIWNEKEDDGDKRKERVPDKPVILSVQEEYEDEEIKDEPQDNIEPLVDDKKSLEKKLGEEVKIKFVYDGDTILLENGDKVRYLDIDTPELNKAGKEDDECLAWEARSRNMELLSQGEVRLVKDSGADRDKYNRLLRYVYVGDVFLNNVLVKEGLAKPFFCQPGWKNCPLAQDEEKKETILNSYEYAQKNNLGIFSSVCIFDKERKITKKESLKKEEIDKEDKEDGVEPRYEEGKKDKKEKINIHLFSNGGDEEEEDYEDIEDHEGGEDSGDVGDEVEEESLLPVVLSFNSYDIDTNNQKYTSSTTVGLSFDIKNKEEVLFYFATTSAKKPDLENNSWSTSTPEYFKISSQTYEDIIYLYLKYKNDEDDFGVLRASSSIIFKASTSPPVLTSLEEKEGVYWINKNKIKLKGNKDLDIVKIILTTEGVSSSTVVSFSENSQKNDWETFFNFEFPCVDYDINQSNLSSIIRSKIFCMRENGFIVNPSNPKETFNPKEIKIFYTKHLKIKAIDRLGNMSSSSLVFIIDDLAPFDLVDNDDMFSHYSKANNQIYLPYSSVDELSNVEEIPFPFVNSGLKNLAWEIKTLSSSDWQNIEPFNVFSQIDAEMTVTSSGFLLDSDKNYSILKRTKDNAGNISTTTKKIETDRRHLVISEIYPNPKEEHGGEWIEIYNPSNVDISLASHTLDTAYDNDVVLSATSIIPAFGYFLIGDKSWTPDQESWPIPDYKATTTITNSGGTIRLKKEGREIDSLKYEDISEGKSLERKATFNSIKETMSPGGEHYNLGNGWDIDDGYDDSYDDFIIKDTPEPQNSLSNREEWEF